LCEFAAKMGFDPLVAEKWETQSITTLKLAAGRMAQQFRGSYKLAILDAFPELKFSDEWLSGVKLEHRAKFDGAYEETSEKSDSFLLSAIK